MEHSLNQVPLSILILFVSLLLFSCFAENVNLDECVSDRPDGFFMGVIHGLIAPITFFISLFVHTIKMYAVNNAGGWYDFGFVLGSGILFGGGASQVKKKKKIN